MEFLTVFTFSIAAPAACGAHPFTCWVSQTCTGGETDFTQLQPSRSLGLVQPLHTDISRGLASSQMKPVLMLHACRRERERESERERERETERERERERQRERERERERRGAPCGSCKKTGAHWLAPNSIWVVDEYDHDGPIRRELAAWMHLSS